MSNLQSELDEIKEKADVARAQQIYLQVLSGQLTPSRYEWIQLAAVFVESFDLVKQVWHSMLSAGHKPTLKNQRSLLKHFRRSGVTPPTEELLKMIAACNLEQKELWQAKLQCIVLETDLAVIHKELSTMCDHGFRSDDVMWHRFSWPTDDPRDILRLLHVIEEIELGRRTSLALEIARLRLRVGDPVDALSLFENNLRDGRIPPLEAFGKLIDALARAGDVEGVLRVREEMSSLGLAPDARSLGSLFKKFANSVDVEGLLRIREEMSSQGLALDAKTLGSLTRALARAGDVEGALRVREEMSSQGLAPDAKTLGTIAQALARAGDVEGALRVREEMSSLGLVPRVWTFETIAQALARAGDVEGALRVREEMSSLEMEPDARTLESIAQALARAGDVEGALRVREEMSFLGLEVPGTVNDFEQLGANRGIFAGAEPIEDRWERRILKTTSHNPREAERCISEMMQERIPVSIRHWQHIVSAYANLQDPTNVVRVFEAITASGLKPNLYCWNSLLKAHVDAWDFNAADQAVEAMRAKGLRPNSFTLSLVLRSFAKRGLTERALSAFWSMMDAGVRPHNTTVTQLLGLLVESGDTTNTRRAIAKLQCSDQRIDQLTLFTALKVFTAALDPEGATEVFQLMQRSGVEPDRRCWDCLIQVYSLCGNHQDVLRLVNDMRERGIEPGSSSFRWLIASLCLSQDLPAARQVLSDMKSKGLNITEYHWVPILNELAESRDREGLRLEEGRIDGHLLASPPIIRVLLKGYGNCRLVDDAERVVSRSADNPAEPSVLCGLARVYALAKKCPSDIDRFSLGNREESSRDAVTAAWIGLALSSSKSDEDALEWMSNYQGSRVMFFHGVRCSVAARVNQEKLAEALRLFFDDVGFTDEALRDGYVRLVVTLTRARRAKDHEITAEVRAAFEAQIKANRPARAILSELIRNETYPWLAMAIAFADHLPVEFFELELLIPDDKQRELAVDSLKFARSWASNPAVESGVRARQA